MHRGNDLDINSINFKFIIRANLMDLVFRNSQPARQFAGVGRAVHHRTGAQCNFRHIHEVVKMRVADQNMIACFDMLIDRLPVNRSTPKIDLLLPRAGEKRINQQGGFAELEFKSGVAKPAKSEFHFNILTKHLQYKRNQWLYSAIQISKII